MPSSDADCLSKGIPAYLHTLGREVLTEFRDEEWLYIRHQPMPAGMRYDAEIGAPLIPNKPLDQSVQWSKLCKHPTDVLYNEKGAHFTTWQIARLQVKEVRSYFCPIPKSVKRGEKPPEPRRFTVKLVHCPTTCLYPHAEIRLEEDGEKLKSAEPPSTLKTHMRKSFAALAELSRVEMHALALPADFGQTGS